MRMRTSCQPLPATTGMVVAWRSPLNRPVSILGESMFLFFLFVLDFDFSLFHSTHFCHSRSISLFLFGGKTVRIRAADLFGSYISVQRTFYQVLSEISWYIFKLSKLNTHNGICGKLWYCTSPAVCCWLVKTNQTQRFYHLNESLNDVTYTNSGAQVLQLCLQSFINVISVRKFPSRPLIISNSGHHRCRNQHT